MNIFKILANGDGSINEPNVSAFLGYLLDPNEDHGLRDQLLRKILYYLYLKNKNSQQLKFLLDNSNSIRHLSIGSRFTFKVELEQAFKQEDSSKQIVDIVILCYEKNETKKESQAIDFVSEKNVGELKQIFLIENKIKAGSTREDQLNKQYNHVKEHLSKINNGNKPNAEDVVSLIFICPLGNASDQEFTNFKKEIPTAHIYWNHVNSFGEEINDENGTMISFLKEIINDEMKGNIDPINDQTKYLLKSFIAFAENDFKSVNEEKLESETVRDVIYDLAQFKTKYDKELNSDAWELIEGLYKKLLENQSNLIIRHSKTHPLSIFARKTGGGLGDKIMSLSKDGNKVCIKLRISHFPIPLEKNDEIISFADSHGFSRSYEDNNRIWVIKSEKFALSDIETIFTMFYQPKN